MSMLTIIIILALVATIVSLGWGLGSMAHGGNYDSEHSGQLMSARVVFQALAIVLLLAAIWLSLG
ncbi:MAG: twin transmembrane helix small protein [Halobacteria archaeon]|nr:twin transmembrane helix small protein [Halobacteria archaeon]